MGKKAKYYDDQLMIDAFDWANKQHDNYTQTRKTLEEANENLFNSRQKDFLSTVMLVLSAILICFIIYAEWNIIQIQNVMEGII